MPSVLSSEESTAETKLDAAQTTSDPHDQSLRAFLLTVSYDGSNYFGWQRQPDHPTVQAEIERGLREITEDEQVKAYASSRTDTGVHAIGQSVVFRTKKWRADAEKIPFAMNTKLPPDVVVRHAREVELGFHPLRDSIGKHYRYQVYSSRKADPLGARFHWWIRRRVSLEAMRKAASYLVGEHDFRSFETTGSPRPHTIRNVTRVDVDCQPHMDGNLYTFDIEANGFLYNMVRNLVGTLIQIGVGRENAEWIPTVLAANDRRAAGATAPPHGLCLVEVKY